MHLRYSKPIIMAIPKFQDFLYPFLYQLKDRDMTLREMKEALIQHFNLTDEDCAIRTQAGSAFMIDDRIGWARQWLRLESDGEDKNN